ncbi:MAG: YciI family protein [Pseudomonadota bacterium]
MLYAIICVDKPGALEVRKANRDAHLAHIRSTDGAIQQAGPFLDADGQMCGSLLLYETADRAEVEAWCAADPYAEAGLFQSVEIRAWNRVIG